MQDRRPWDRQPTTCSRSTALRTCRRAARPSSRSRGGDQGIWRCRPWRHGHRGRHRRNWWQAPPASPSPPAIQRSSAPCSAGNIVPPGPLRRCRRGGWQRHPDRSRSPCRAGCDRRCAAPAAPAGRISPATRHVWLPAAAICHPADTGCDPRSTSACTHRSDQAGSRCWPSPNSCCAPAAGTARRGSWRRRNPSLHPNAPPIPTRSPRLPTAGGC